MAFIRAYESFEPFIWTLKDHGHMNVSHDLLSLRFNVQMENMYVEQEMHYMNGNILKTILLQKNSSEDRHS